MMSRISLHAEACCRWIQGQRGPDFLFVSPGLHDCYHDPDQYGHHARKLRHLVEHLAALPQTVVYVDMNPSTWGANSQKILKCVFYVNAAGHALAKEFGLLMFSRQTMIVSGDQKDKDGTFPMHQADDIVSTELRYLLAWLGCILEHKRAGTLTA